MTSAATAALASQGSVALPHRMRMLRDSHRVRWLGHPVSYTIGTTIASLLSIGTSLLAPSLLGPAAFGTFALLTSLFQYASRFDMGLSQLADRDLAAGATPAPGRDGEILYANWLAGLLILVVITPLAAIAASWTTTMTPLDTALAVGGGALAMVANAPVTIFRASARVWEFTTVALTLQAGMTLPRLFGLMVAGITGCFVALVAWYAVLALIFARPAALAFPPPKRLFGLWRAAFPLFLFNALWLVYLTANRWIAAFLTTPEELGLFAFGANLAFVGLGMISTIAQVYYPKLLARIVRSPAGACSRAIEGQSLALGGLLTGVSVLAIVAAPGLIPWLFPQYGSATASTVILSISCLPMGLVAWLVPLSIALSKTPKRDAVRIFVPAVLVLVVAMAAGQSILETEGLAWGCVIGGFALLIAAAAHLRGIAVLSRQSALRMIGLQGVLIGALSALAIAAFPQAGRSATLNAGGPPAGWRLAFDETFDTLKLWDPARRSGVWEPHYPWGARTNASNGELQYYVDPRAGNESPALVRFNPFFIDKNGLVIRARPLPADLATQTGHAFASGLLTTAQSFSFTYGYVEMRARVPRGRGLWSAFWLAPVDQSWPPEIDILESLGDDTRNYVMTAHSSFLGFHGQSQFRVTTPDLADAFHTYAVKWTADEIVWYFDGRKVATTATPGGTHKPMYLIVNLAVGGNWPGAPDVSTPFPADFQIDSIRAYLPPEAQLR
ncbi:family 16 glycosylhydrolase [Microvirga antarctica]|uniref:family 16 glycosylhydrolase n=1 Tax=Microvirga antarctica TaxID=2819233 RepID=UPI001B3059EF|nr:family 16 glycosylhydrolase [Microvirga antarctica]